MSDLGGLPKLPAACTQCGEPFSATACGPTHAMIWHSIEAPMRGDGTPGPAPEGAPSEAVAKARADILHRMDGWTVQLTQDPTLAERLEPEEALDRYAAALRAELARAGTEPRVGMSEEDLKGSIRFTEAVTWEHAAQICDVTARHCATAGDEKSAGTADYLAKKLRARATAPDAERREPTP